MTRHDDETGEAKTVWRSQLDTLPIPTMATLRADALAFDERIDRRNTIETAAGALGIAGWAGVLWWSPSGVMQLGSAMVIMGAIFVLWQLQRRTGRRGTPPEALGDASLQYHRAELTRQRDALSSVWRWYVAPLVPGTLMFYWGAVERFPDISWWPAIAGAAGIVAAVLVLNRLGARRLQRQIQALDRLLDPSDV